MEQVRAALVKSKLGSASVGLQESLVILLDRSGSMDDPVDGTFGHGEKKMAAAIRAAKALVEDCRYGLTEIAILSFARTVTVHVGMTRNIKVVSDLIKPIRPGYETFLGMGLTRAIDMLSESSARIRRIVAMSDGRDDPGRSHETEQCVVFCVQRKIIIDTIAFGEDADRYLLEQIARRTGGVFREAIDAMDLVNAFKSLEAGIRGLLEGKVEK